MDSFPPIVKTTYALKPQGAVTTAAEACTLCHAAAGPPELNAYGKDVKAALKASGGNTLTAAILHSIDSKDSDGDGATNGAEFAADTLPGDAASKPAGTVAPAAGAAGGSGEDEHKSTGAAILALMFPKHGQHPAVVHVPIGAFIISLIFDVIAVWKKNRNLALAGYYNLIAGAVTSFGAIATGLLAWWFAFGHAAIKGTLLNHLILGIVTSVLMLVMWAVRSKATDKGAVVSKAYLLLGLIGVILVSVTGHLGGNLSGVN